MSKLPDDISDAINWLCEAYLHDLPFEQRVHARVRISDEFAKLLTKLVSAEKRAEELQIALDDAWLKDADKIMALESRLSSCQRAIQDAVHSLEANRTPSRRCYPPSAIRARLRRPSS